MTATPKTSTKDRIIFTILGCLSLLLLAIAYCKSQVPERAQALLKEKKFDEAVALLETAYASNHSSPEIKAELVTATVAYANELMYRSELPPQEKYPRALRLYRRVLQLDPQQRDAMEGKNMIESIYQSMGRPVPQ